MTLLPLVPLVAGIALLAIGTLALTGRLPRNRFAGVRTAATLRSDEAFRVGNKVAGLPTVVAGAVGILGALAAWATQPLMVTIIALAGLLTLSVGGGVLGSRAAAAVPEPEPELPAGCKGCQCGAGGCGVFQKA
ncbi:SdpI family protein [Actinokineospora guangxiensis]|uniref:SdpI family protein n=1 Tax=Actinokineospora guangxiensis TaxID=1490288 RepID=A0ABW0EH37_9PSEU